ncbi:hypothetical protein, partial [Escherichia coli]|uniref:hypothetical protein n=1 Tax=Escherichia coli TaxID=562 RepID=UPI0032DBC65E
MHSQDPITKLTQTLQRDDGSQVRIVAQRGYGSGLTASLDVYVLRRDSSESNWSLCGKDPHPEWRKMSVDEYQKFGHCCKVSDEAAFCLIQRPYISKTLLT